MSLLVLHHSQEHLITGFTNDYLIVQVHHKLLTTCLGFPLVDFITLNIRTIDGYVTSSYSRNHFFKHSQGRNKRILFFDLILFSLFELLLVSTYDDEFLFNLVNPI